MLFPRGIQSTAPSAERWSNGGVFQGHVLVQMQFKYFRLSKVAQVGDVTIEVNDPKDQKEIEKVLREQSFLSFLPTDEEWDDVQWQFAEAVEDDEQFEFDMYDAATGFEGYAENDDE